MPALPERFLLYSKLYIHVAAYYKKKAAQNSHKEPIWSLVAYRTSSLKSTLESPLSALPPSQESTEIIEKNIHCTCINSNDLNLYG